MRLFAAVVPPGPVALAIAESARVWLGGVGALRRVPAGRLHLTLAFLGEQSVQEVERIDALLRRALFGMAGFEVSASDWGRFPPRGRPRVYWLGLESEVGLDELAECVRTTLAPFLPDPGERRFSPHITVARSRGTGGRGTPSQATPAPDLTWLVDEVQLIRSRLGPGPATYTPLERYPLLVREVGDS